MNKFRNAKDKRGTRCQWCSLRTATHVDSTGWRRCNDCEQSQGIPRPPTTVSRASR